MSKQRDAASGRYISEEQAEQQDKSTWIEEHDKPKFGMSDRTHLLISIYTAIKNSSWESLEEGNPLIDLNSIKEIFKNSGVDIDQLQAEGKINLD